MLAQGVRDVVERPGADDIRRTVGLDERRIFGQAYGEIGALLRGAGAEEPRRAADGDRPCCAPDRWRSRAALVGHTPAQAVPHEWGGRGVGF